MDVSFLHIVVFVLLPTLPLHQSACNECEYDVDIITFLVPASSDVVVVAGVVVYSSSRRVRLAI
jgi:hypothetical protein